jgi:capsular exopolysaccharide synthesis family protein
MESTKENTSVQYYSDTEQEMEIDLREIFFLCLSKWRWFVLSITVCLAIAIAYLLHTTPVYTRSASILVKDNSNGVSTASTAAESFSDIGLFNANNSVNDEIGMLKSPDLMREVVSKLHLYMDYQVPGRFHKETIYGDSLPVNVTIVGLSDNESAKFTLRLLEDGAVSLSDFKRNGESVGDETVEGVMNDYIESPIGTIIVASSDSIDHGTETKEIYVSRYPIGDKVRDCEARLDVAREDKQSNIISLTYKDVSPKRAEDVLAMLIMVYDENWIKDKNRITVSTSLFINERLGVIESELGNVDNDISSYKSANLLPDVQAAANMYMNKANEADASVIDLNNQIYMAKYIKNYLLNESNKYQILPTNYGIDNTNTNTQIKEYNDKLLERNSLISHSSEKNPLVVEMDASLSAMRAALITSIDNQLVALNAQIKSQKAVGGKAASQIASNPKQSKYLLSVERQQKVKESLYLYLLQKREENELSQAFTAYNTRIITEPGGNMAPTSPVKRNIILAAFVLGLLIPLGIIFLIETMNTKVSGRGDLKKMTVPLIGEIPLCVTSKRKLPINKPREAGMIVVKNGSRNVVNEAFRVLRTNLEFMTGKADKSNVIITTSFNPGSGKSFLTLNIAVSLALKGKKVLIIDGDMRHGSTSSYINSPSKGLSDYLCGKTDNLSELIVADKEHEHLDILPVGTMPPNPTELLFDDRLKTVINRARELYDYVFIDCPPIEIVADTQIIEKLADRTIFVVRAGLLERKMLPELEKLYVEKKYKNISMILNGTEMGSGRYGYRYGYHYGYGYYGYGYHNTSDKEYAV